MKSENPKPQTPNPKPQTHNPTLFKFKRAQADLACKLAS